MKILALERQLPNATSEDFQRYHWCIKWAFETQVSVSFHNSALTFAALIGYKLKTKTHHF